MSDRSNRIRNALWGLFAGDALAMPVHWFYGLENIGKTFDGGIKNYEAAPHPSLRKLYGGNGLSSQCSECRKDRAQV